MTMTKHRTNLVQKITQSNTLGEAIEIIHDQLAESDNIQAFTTKEKAIAYFMGARNETDQPVPLHVGKQTDTSVSFNEWLFNQTNEYGVAKDGSVIVFN